MEEITCYIRPRRESTTLSTTCKDHEKTYMEQQTVNSTQSPTDFIKTFQNWRDEIYNYEQSVTELPT
eukprot:4097055-Amphidinium_carterae.1